MDIEAIDTPKKDTAGVKRGVRPDDVKNKKSMKKGVQSLQISEIF